MRLVADRFVVDVEDAADNDGYAIDLATGRAVRLTVMPAGDLAGLRRWMLRCDDALGVRRCAEPILIDYGRIGAGDRFEAWAHPGGGAGAAAAPAVPGIVTIERPEMAALVEMCERPEDRRPKLVALWGPRGSGRATVVESLARAARRNGIVPIDGRLLGAYHRLIVRRTLLVIDTTPTRCGLASWLLALLSAPRPHLCVFVGDQEVPGVDGVALRRVSVSALVAAVHPAPESPQQARRVARAAARARGLPGRFVRALWPPRPPAPAQAPAGAPASRVAERTASYDDRPHSDGPEGTPVTFGGASGGRPEWPSPGDLAALRRRLATGETLLAAGRHAPAVRTLRQATAALARRDAWTDASRGAMALAAALLGRGRTRHALRVVDEAREHAAKSGDRSLLLDLAVLSGEAWIDLARLDEAEQVLAGTMAAARAYGDPVRRLRAATSLSRCLFWRGSYSEAASLLDADADPGDPGLGVRRLRMLGRASAALGNTAGAMRAVEEARSLATTSGDRRLAAGVALTSAFVRLAIGDLDGVDREVAECLASARAARQPMGALRARLLQIEADRRRAPGRAAAALAALQRLLATAPPIVRARAGLVESLERSPDAKTVAEQAARTGLKGLEMFGGAAPQGAGLRNADPFVEEVVDILRVCQHADEEIAILKDVCARVRRHLHAAAAAFVCPGARRFEVLAGEGAGMETEAAERAYEGGLTIGPLRVRERLEGAAAVQYGGRVIGALSARWTIGTPHDVSRAGAVLSMAATAAAPVLAALLARRAPPSAPAILDLLGVTSAIADLRTAIERAAPAPFTVLIEGESGSGKELVARAIHRCSLRRDRAFCTVNCAALPDDLVEAELFGHARGAFTGAVGERPGVFEQAHGGTLLLDEVGELSARAQAKLLRVVQEGELRRIGENVARRIDVRVVCATNRDLRREVEAGRFRQDLLYRLDVIRIEVPPLRARRDDVPILVDHFWSDAARRVGSRATLAAGTRSVLAAYDWPGNVRELQNVLASLAVRSPRRGVVPPSALPAHLTGAGRSDVWRLDAARRSFEQAFVRAALVRSGGRRTRAAAELGITRQGLTKLIARLQIAP